MSVVDTLVTALQSVRANALRTFLSMLGIIIGVAAVITVVSIGTGSQQAVLANISQLGSNLITINPALSRGTAGRLSQGAQGTFTLDMADEIERAVPYVHNVVPLVSQSGLLVAGTENLQVGLLGVTEPYQTVMNYSPVSGRFILDDDVSAERYVIVLGAEVAEELFGENDPVGSEVLVVVNDRRYTFTVVGVMESKGQMLGGNFDRQAYMPVTVMMRRVAKTNRVSSYSAQALSSALAAEAVEQVEFFLARRLGPNRARITSQDQMMQTMSEVGRTLSLMLGGIASIALLVGGIGIMNIMLVSVTERTREIGTRKALGAKRRDILLQFMIESFGLAAVGGLVGVAVGWGGALLIARMGGWPATVSLWSVALAMAFSGGVGLFFGIYPAMKAARLDPVQALAYE